MKVDRANKFVVSLAGAFCEIVSSQISLSWGPIDLELALGDAVAEPVKAHVNGFGSILLDGVVEDTIGSAVVGLDRGRMLPESQFNESDSVGDCHTGIEVASTEFGFSGIGEDVLHDCCHGAEGCIKKFSRNDAAWGESVGTREFFFNVVIHGSFESVIHIVPVKVNTSMNGSTEMLTS